MALYPCDPPTPGPWDSSFQAALDALPCAAWVNDVQGDGLMVHVNRHGLELFEAASVEELRTRGTGAHMTPGARSEVQHTLQQALRREAIARHWTIFPNGRALNLNVAVSYTWLRPNHPALVVTAAPARHIAPEQRAATMLRHVPNSVFMISRSGALIHANPASEKALEEHSWAGYLPPDLIGELSELSEVGNTLERVVALPAEGSPRRPFQLVAARALDPVEGGPAAIVSLTNVSDLVAAQEALVEAREALEQQVRLRTRDLSMEKDALAAILDAVQAGVAMVNPSGIVERANRTLKDWLPGIEGEAIAARLELGQERLTELIENEGPRLLSTPHGPLTIAWSMCRAPSTGHFILTGHDLSTQYALEEQLHESQTLASLGRLAATLAHEINNPLTSVVACASLLLEAVDEDRPLRAPEVKELAEECLEGGRRAGRVVRHIKATAGAPAEALSRVSVAGAVARALQHTHARRPASIRIHAEVPPGLYVRASLEQLAQVVVNLLENAFEALAPQPTALIRITAQEVSDRVEIEVLDDGPGMDETVRSRAFEEFFTTKAHRLGRGLGLPISLALVRSFGGELEIDSTRDQGTKIRVLLRTEAPPPDDETTSNRPKTADFGRSLLFVDDEHGLHGAIARLLPELDVRTAASGEDAVALMQGALPDVLLTDIVMPNGDGRWLYQQVQSRWPSLAERTIFTSGGTLSVDVARFVSETGRPFLPKPFEPEELRRFVAEQLEAHPRPAPAG